MKKKIFLLFLSFVISHTSEIDIILSGLSEKKEKIFTKQNFKIASGISPKNGACLRTFWGVRRLQMAAHGISKPTQF